MPCHITLGITMHKLQHSEEFLWQRFCAQLYGNATSCHPACILKRCLWLYAAELYVWSVPLKYWAIAITFTCYSKSCLCILDNSSICVGCSTGWNFVMWMVSCMHHAIMGCKSKIKSCIKISDDKYCSIFLTEIQSVRQSICHAIYLESWLEI